MEICLFLYSILKDLHALFIFLHVKSLYQYTCMVSAWQFGLSSQDLTKDANMITITQFMLTELGDELNLGAHNCKFTL